MIIGYFQNGKTDNSEQLLFMSNPNDGITNIENVTKKIYKSITQNVGGFKSLLS